jgi:alpha-glucosidase
MKPLLPTVAAAFLLAGAARTAPAAPVSVASPDGRTVLTFDVKDLDGAAGCPVYRVDFKGKPVVAESRLGLEIEGAPLLDGLAVVKQAPGKRDETWKPVCGERAVVRDRCSTLEIDLKESKAPGRALRVDVRVYDEGAAFCCTLPKQPGLDRVVIARERTEFRLSGDHPAWAVYSAQGKYEKVPVSRIKPGCERPLVLQAADDLYVALGEARLVDYARMKFAPLPGAPHALVSHLDGKVEAALPLTTPWRFVMAAESPGRLLENNDLLLNLNDSCAIADISWIRPGKVIREVTLTTTGGKACVDFAAKRGLQYVEFDAGWYGHEYDDASDASAVNVDPKRSKGPLDLPEVIRYAKEKGVGVILYVNRRALEKQLDQILPLYRSWGVSGVKYGFVNVGPQRWTAWLHEAIRKAAAQRLMVDVHDEYRGTGYSRTYPNLMTVEGIGGDETSPSNEQTLILQFARYLAGPADNTICYYDKRVDANATHAYQLAKAVCLFSPWQFLFWYDRPASAQDEPELEFYNHVPAVWDDTKVLHGRIGEYAAVARRRGDAWFIGVMNSGEARTLDLPLAFLEKGKRYAAHVYSDDPSTATRTKVKVERFAVTAETTLKAAVSEKGGQAIRIAPAGAGEALPAYK